jgi:hypothetical protein
MSSLVWLGLTVAFVLVVVLAGLAPRGGKPIERTRLMKSARFVLIGGVVVCGALSLMTAFRH